MRFEVGAAWALGVMLPVLETARRRTDFSNIPAYVDDYIIGALLITAAWSTTRGKRYGPSLLVGAWGVFCGGMYYSFFGQLNNPEQTDVSGFPNWIVICVKSVLFIVGLTGFGYGIRRAARDIPSALR